MTMWFDREPGDTAMVCKDDDGILLVDATMTPDWVRLPEDLGGARVRVVGDWVGDCPSCFASGVTHLRLDAMTPEGRSYCVAECMADGFLWYSLR